jgi:hypothetical protein
MGQETRRIKELRAEMILAKESKIQSWISKVSDEIDNLKI